MRQKKEDNESKSALKRKKERKKECSIEDKKETRDSKIQRE